VRGAPARSARAHGCGSTGGSSTARPRRTAPARLPRRPRRPDVDALGRRNLGTIALRDLERVHELHRRYYAELRAIVGASQPAEALLLADVQLARIP